MESYSYNCGIIPTNNTCGTINANNYCTTCLPTFNYVQSEYERLKYVGRVVKYKGKKWICGINWPRCGGIEETINLKRITIFGNVVSLIALEKDIKLWR